MKVGMNFFISHSFRLLKRTAVLYSSIIVSVLKNTGFTQETHWTNWFSCKPPYVTGAITCRQRPLTWNDRSVLLTFRTARPHFACSSAATRRATSWSKRSSVTSTNQTWTVTTWWSWTRGPLCTSGSVSWRRAGSCVHGFSAAERRFLLRRQKAFWNNKEDFPFWRSRKMFVFSLTVRKFYKV